MKRTKRIPGVRFLCDGCLVGGFHKCVGERMRLEYPDGTAYAGPCECAECAFIKGKPKATRTPTAEIVFE